MIYILDAVSREYTMLFVRVYHTSDGRCRVVEGLTNR
jgi:hypothetical protein